jgi:hypothetical protein
MSWPQLVGRGSGRASLKVRRPSGYVTWFEREGEQQPAQPGARHLGDDAVVRANLERPKQPDPHPADFAMGGLAGLHLL